MVEGLAEMKGRRERIEKGDREKRKRQNDNLKRRWPERPLVWRSRPFTKCSAGERVWNHAIHRVVICSSIPATREFH